MKLLVDRSERHEKILGGDGFGNNGLQADFRNHQMEYKTHTKWLGVLCAAVGAIVASGISSVVSYVMKTASSGAIDTLSRTVCSLLNAVDIDILSGIYKITAVYFS